jgi:hypothetical protein
VAEVRCFDAAGSPANALFTALYTVGGSDPYARFAYLWADNPTASTYTPSAPYQRNPSGRLSTITRIDEGLWDARLPGMASNGGNVQVTAYGKTPARCSVSSWQNQSPDEVVRVACFSPFGKRIDVPFTLSFADQSTLFGIRGHYQVGAYAWVPASGALSPSYSWHWSGRTNSSARDATGVYRVTISDAGFRPDHVQVTAYGSNGNHCKVGSWNVLGAASTIKVLCFTAAGASADSAFSLAYLGPLVPQ